MFRFVVCRKKKCHSSAYYLLFIQYCSDAHDRNSLRRTLKKNKKCLTHAYTTTVLSLYPAGAMVVKTVDNDDNDKQRISFPGGCE